MEPSSSRNPGRTNCTKRTWPAAVFLHQYLSQLPGGLQRSGASGAWHGTGSGAAAEHGADPRGVSGCAVIELGSGTGWLAAKRASFMAAAATGEASAGAGDKVFPLVATQGLRLSLTLDNVYDTSYRGRRL